MFNLHVIKVVGVNYDQLMVNKPPVGGKTPK